MDEILCTLGELQDDVFFAMVRDFAVQLALIVGTGLIMALIVGAGLCLIYIIRECSNTTLCSSTTDLTK